MKKINKFSKISLIFCLILIGLFYFSSKSGAKLEKIKLNVLAGDPPTVEYEKIDTSNISIVSSKSCLLKDFNPQLSSVKLSCSNGSMQGSILGLKISDVTAGIERMNLMIASLERTRQYMIAAKGKNGFDLVAIPAGLVIEKKYETAADSLSIMCLKDSSGTIIDGAAAIGNLYSDRGFIFDTRPKAQIDLITKIKAQGKTDISKFMEIMNGPESLLSNIFTLIGIGKRMMSGQTELAQNTIPITREELATNYPEFVNDSVAVSTINLRLRPATYDQAVRGGGGNKIVASYSSQAETYMGILGVSGPLYYASLDADGSVLDFPEMGIPYDFMITQILSAISQHEKRLSDDIKSHQLKLKFLQKSLDALRAVNYKCQ